MARILNGVVQNQVRLRIRYWDDDDATFEGVPFRDLLFDDIFAIIEEAGGPVTASDMNASLRSGWMSNYSSQHYKKHCWTIPGDIHIEDEAKALGFKVERPKHRKTGNPLPHGWAIDV